MNREHRSEPGWPGARVGAYREAAAPPDEAPWIEALWVHEPPVDTPPGARHRVVPDVACSLVFECERDESGRPSRGRLRLYGPVLHARFYRPEPGTRLAGVRLKPEWAGKLLGITPGEHVDALDDLAEIDGDLDRDLTAALEPTRSGPEAARRLSAAVAERARRRHLHEARCPVAAAIARLRTQPGLAVNELAGDLAMTPRHLRRLVNERTGASPRRLATLQRFLRLVAEADRTERPSWVDLAARHGYADQPHLIRESRRLSGLTPATLHAERRTASV